MTAEPQSDDTFEVRQGAVGAEHRVCPLARLGKGTQEIHPAKDVMGNAPVGDPTWQPVHGRGHASMALVAALAASLLMILPCARESAAADLRVDRNNTTGSANGSSLRPYATIQAALDAAAAGDSVLVARGTYAGNVRIEEKRIALRGGYAGGASADYAANRPGDFSTQLPGANVTIIQGSPGAAAVLILSPAIEGAADGSLVDGFTIRGGDHGIEIDDNFTFPTLIGVTISRNVLEQNGVAEGNHRGGGIYLSGSDHVVTDNIIRNNVGGRGAGVALCCDNITFQRNRVEDNVGYGDHGGGINQVGTGVLTDNVIRGNRTGEGLTYGWGGGILILGTPELRRNVFTGNYAPGRGGAVIVDEGARAVFEHELIFANSVREGGGGIYVDGGAGPSRADIRHCTITGNTSEETRAGNAVYVEGGSSVTLVNTIAWGNQGDDFQTIDTSTITATYTLSQEGIAGTGNISTDPLFANPAANDYHLRSTAGRWDPLANGGAGGFVIDAQHSPAIDAADPGADFSAEPPPNGGRANLGVYGNTAEASKSGSGPMGTSTATLTRMATATPTRTPTGTGGGATATASRTATRTASPTPVKTTYYVAPGGDDGNPGTEGAPWRTLQKAGDSTTAGTDVVVLPGTYDGFRPRTSGRAGAPIRFLARPGAVITAPGPANANGDNIWIRNVEYIVLDGFESRGAPRAGIAVQGEPDANVAGVVVRNCFCHDNGRWGIFTSFARDLLIENNETSFSRDEHGIYVSNSGDRVVVRGNHAHDNARAGIQLNADPAQQGDDPTDPQGDGIIEDALIEGNRIHDNGVVGGAGINLASVRSSLVRNNLLYDNHASGIAGWDDDEGSNQYGTRDNRFIGNTIVQASDGRFALSLIHGSINNVVENNILLHRGSRGSLVVDPSSREGLRSDYNVVVDVFSDDENFFGFAAWRALGFDANSIVATAAALFADETADDYRLSATSPAVDRGAPRADLPADFAGRRRPQGAGFDIGAYEFGDGAGACRGDCNEDGEVNVDELLMGVSIAIGTADVDTCPSMDGNDDGVVIVNELVAAVRSVVEGCSPLP
jgi:hypothetical protein